MEAKRPGWKSSEAVGGVGLVGTILFFTQDKNPSVQIVGIAAVCLLGAAYMISRALVKK